jgi:AraC family transcriptional regulator
MSKYHFLRSFRRVYGTTPYRYLQARRLAQFVCRLDQATDQITTIALDCGFTDISTFNARFKAVFGQSPSSWRARA